MGVECILKIVCIIKPLSLHWVSLSTTTALLVLAKLKQPFGDLKGPCPRILRSLSTTPSSSFFLSLGSISSTACNNNIYIEREREFDCF